MKKIMFLIPSLNSGGAERVITTLANEFSKREFKVSMVTLSKGHSFYHLSDDIETINAGLNISKKNPLTRFFSKAKNFIGAYKFVKKMITVKKPDIIISFLTDTNLIVSWLKKDFKEIKIIISERADPKKRNFITRAIIKRSYKKIDYLVCQTPSIASYFKGMENKIKIIMNPANNIHHDTSVINKEPFEFISIGRLAKQKRYDIALKSLKNIDKSRYKFKYRIYGEGPLKKKIQKNIIRFNLQENVILMGNVKDIFNEIKKSNLLIMTSDFEGYPNALIEAISLGKPVVTTNFNQDISNYINKNKMGFVIERGNHKKLTSLLLSILKNEININDFNNKHEIIYRDMNLDKILGEWEGLIK